MFQKMAEHIYFHLLRKNLLNQEDKEVYIYALEVVLLNASLLIALFFISLCMGQLACFAYFFCFFVPLRIFSGGYHAKKSETCFPMSVISYMLVMLIAKYHLDLSENIFIQGITVTTLVLLFILAPVENKNHPLDKGQMQRNKRIVRFLVLADSILLLIFWTNDMTAAGYGMIFVLLNGLLFFVGKVENIMLCRK